MKQLKVSTIIFSSIIYLCLITSCGNDELTPRLSELNNAEIVNMIKINFLKEYGGIERERIEVCNYPLTHSEICEIDTTINLSLSDTDSNFEVMLIGEYKISCLNDAVVYNDRFIQYFDRGSTGKSSLDNISQEFDLQSGFRVSGNTVEGIYTTSGHTARNLTYTNEEYEHIDGIIRFRLDTHEFDFTGCLLTDESEYSCTLSLFNKNEGEDRLIINGIIKLIDNSWTLITEDGIITALE